MFTARFLGFYLIVALLTATGVGVYHLNFNDFLAALYGFGILFVVGGTMMGTLASPKYDK